MLMAGIIFTLGEGFRLGSVDFSLSADSNPWYTPVTKKYLLTTTTFIKSPCCTSQSIVVSTNSDILTMAPKGYEKTKISSAKGLGDKEVYLVQLPENFDTKKAEFKSNTEVTCQGNSYFVSTSSALADCGILNTDKSGKLIPSDVKLDGLLSFTKKVSVPKVDYEKVIHAKPLVPQKKDLRMRHFPTGYGPESYGVDTTERKKSANEDKESSNEIAHPKKHKQPKEPKEPKESVSKDSKKHKHSRDADADAGSDKPAKKQKKNNDEKKSKKHKSKE